MAERTGQLDTQIEIITPENIAFQYRVAGPFHRLPAYLIDIVVRVFVAVIALFGFLLVFGIAAAPGLGFGLWLVLWFVLEWLYGGLFETFWNGQTPGKRLMRLRVVSTDGQPISGFQAVLRNVLRAVDAMPIVPLFGALPVPTYQLGLTATMLNDRFQRLGDLACGTMVVIEEPQARYGVIAIEEPDAIRLASLLPASFQPSRSLALALSNYVSRRRRFGWSRRIEIARHLAEPLRVRFGLPRETSPDLLLCGLYHKTFFSDIESDESREPPDASAAGRARETGEAVMAAGEARR